MNNISWTNWALVGLVAIILIAGGWWLMSRNTENVGALNERETENEEESSETPSSIPNTIKPAASTTSNAESVSVEDQPAGSSVEIGSVKFSAPGWIAVRDDRGWTLGAGWFGEGTHVDVSVPLLRATTAGERYQVLLYIDDGDRKFDLDTEILVMRSDGSVAGAMFTAK